MISVQDFDRFVFVVGAPRCGTTTLAHFLKQHHAVSFPVVKEPHFFAQRDLRSLQTDELRPAVEDEYLRRFFQRTPGSRVGVDASVTYLYVPEQLEPTLKLWPHSKFVIALRDPLEMLPSLHRRLIYNGDETIADFGRAWAASGERAAGLKIPRRCIEPRWLSYDEAARFGTYVQRLFDTVGRDRCLVVLFDDLAEDPAREHRRLFEFLGVEAPAKPDLKARRAGSDVRARWLQRLLKRPPAKLRNQLAGEAFNSRFRDHNDDRSAPSAVLSLRRRLLRWNSLPPRPLSLSVRVQQEVREALRPEIERLEHLIGRDLSGWLQIDTPGVLAGRSRIETRIS